MSEVFHHYEPKTGHQRLSCLACDACYSRKVRCEFGEHSHACQQCIRHGVSCVPRRRKRKACAVNIGAVQRVNIVPHQLGALQTQHESPRCPSQSPRNSGNPESVHASSHHHELSNSEGLHLSYGPLLFITKEARSNDLEVPNDKCRNAAFLSRSAILGDDFPNIDHAHPDRSEDELELLSIDTETLERLDVFTLPELPLRQSLYEAFVERCWPWTPVLDLKDFETTLNNDQDSLLLKRAVMLAGAIVRPEVCSKSFVESCYVRLKALIQSGYENDPLKTLGALCIIQWYTPAAPKDVSTDVPRFWNTYALGLAHQIGLHREPSDADPNPRLRRRIWHTLVVRDCQTSAAHGRPRLINPDDSDVVLEGYRCFCPQDGSIGNIFLSYVTTTTLLGDLCQLVRISGDL